MKVLFVHHYPSKGGSSNSLSILLESLASENLELLVATPEGDAAEKFRRIKGVDVHIIGRFPEVTNVYGVSFPVLRILYSLRYLPNHQKLKDLIQQVKPDIVHFNELSFSYTAKIAKKQGVKVAMHVRVALRDRPYVIKRLVNYFLKKYVDLLIPIDMAASLNITNEVKKEVVHNPVEVRDTHSKYISGSSKSKNFKIVFLANLMPQKGIYDVLKIANSLKDHKDIEFLIAGQPSLPIEYFKTLKGRMLELLGLYRDHGKIIKKYINENKLSNVQMLGYVDNVSELLGKVDLNLLPSYMNQPSRCIYESGAMGVPSILTMKDRVEDVIEDGETGYIFSEGDISKIAEAIKYLKNNQAILNEMGNKCREKYQNSHDREMVKDKILNLYGDLINE